MTLTELEEASRDGLAVCLACGAAQDRVALPDEGCSECGDDAVYSAEFILRAAGFVARLWETQADEEDS